MLLRGDGRDSGVRGAFSVHSTNKAPRAPALPPPAAKLAQEARNPWAAHSAILRLSLALRPGVFSCNGVVR